jgi:hypothetical protein
VSGWERVKTGGHNGRMKRKLKEELKIAIWRTEMNSASQFSAFGLFDFCF